MLKARTLEECPGIDRDIDYMRFIHFSDIRIGNSAESGTLWEQARSLELQGGLERVMREAADYDAGLVLISGGLFAHVPASSELDKANRVFAGYPGIDVVITAGISDPAGKSAPVRSFAWANNVHCVTADKAKLVINRLRTEVYAASVTDAGCTEPAELGELISESRDDTQPIRIAVLYSDNDDSVRTALKDAGLSYAAVGSTVQGSRKLSNNIACPGSFEPDAMGDSGIHGLYCGEISDRTGILENLEFKPMASASYVPLLIKTNVKTTAEELEALVKAEITRRGTSNIYRLKLTGQRNPEESFELDKLKSECRISEIIDETEPEYDFRALFAEHSQDMIGFYIAKIVNDKHEMSAVEKQAMYYGLNALLSTTEE